MSKAVWQYFLEQAITNKGTPDCQKPVDSLTDVDLNGREVRLYFPLFLN